MVALREKLDRGLESRLDEFEQRIFVLKVEYEKYFSGIEKVEPLRERDDLRRLLRDLMQQPIRNTRQRHKLATLRARWGSLEYYWQRNLYMIERGTHPKMRFRAGLAERRREQAQERAKAARAATPEQRASAEDLAYKELFDNYVTARRQCGQSAELSFDAVKDALQKQVRTIQSRYRCSSVVFRVTIEEGKAKVKAIPKR